MGAIIIKLSYPIKKTKLDPNGGLPVNIQDQTTAPVLTYFLKSVSNFTLSSDTGESGTEVEELVYTFNAVGGHGIQADDEIILLDVIADRQFYAKVSSVVDNTITLDRPIDHNFESSSSIGRIVTSDLRVDGSSTPQIFTVRAGMVPSDTTYFCLSIVCDSEPSDDLFANITELTRGISFRVIDGYHKVLGNIKNNATLRAFGAHIEYNDKAGGSNWSVHICLPFRDIWGIAFRVRETGLLQLIIQDDLTNIKIIKLQASLAGHLTQGEV